MEECSCVIFQRIPRRDLPKTELATLVVRGWTTPCFLGGFAVPWSRMRKEKLSDDGAISCRNAHKVQLWPLAAHLVKKPPAVRETQLRSLGREDPLEKGMATHSSILAWRIPWTEEPGGLQSMGSQESDTTEWLAHTYTQDGPCYAFGEELKWKPRPCLGVIWARRFFVCRRWQVFGGHHGAAVLDRARGGEPALRKPLLLHGAVGQQPRAPSDEREGHPRAGDGGGQGEFQKRLNRDPHSM